MKSTDEDGEVDDIDERAMETSLKPSPALVAVVVAILTILSNIVCQ